MDTITEKDYAELNSRLNQAQQKRAVLQAREEQKAQEREVLEKELTAAGINTKDPEAEIIRLEAEIKADFEKQSKAINEFENQVAAAMADQNKPATTPSFNAVDI